MFKCAGKCPGEDNIALTKILQKDDSILYLIGNADCYLLNQYVSGNSEEFFFCERVFLVVEESQISDLENYNFFLPAGQYLSLTYRGHYNKTRQLYPKMVYYARAHDYEITGSLIEICRLGVYQTDQAEEFLTELQVRVKSR